MNTSAEDRREYVHCALCGADQAETLNKIDAQNLSHGPPRQPAVQKSSIRPETVVRCQRCGLVYVNPRFIECQEELSDETRGELQFFVSTRASRSGAYRELLGRIPDWLGHSPDTMLDIGCGDGLLLGIARELGVQVHGLEVNPALTDWVNRSLGQGTASSQPLTAFGEESYDLVTLINVVEHLREPAVTLREVCRVLKPGGLALVHVPNLGGLPAKLAGARWKHIDPFVHFHYFTEATLTAMLTQAGLVPATRFALFTQTGWKRQLHRLLHAVSPNIGNGLGIAALKPVRGGHGDGFQVSNPERRVGARAPGALQRPTRLL